MSQLLLLRSSSYQISYILYEFDKIAIFVDIRNNECTIFSSDLCLYNLSLTNSFLLLGCIDQFHHNALMTQMHTKPLEPKIRRLNIKWRNNVANELSHVFGVYLSFSFEATRLLLLSFFCMFTNKDIIKILKS